MPKIFSYILIMLAISSCRENFDPPGTAEEKSYLVVEGVINSGTGPTTIRLSRTVPLADSSQPKPVFNATVRVEGSNNSFTTLFETSNGVYSNNQLLLADNVKYRLHIYLNGGREYMTEYMSARKAPPIDSISWERVAEGVELFVNTHDPQDTTRYYRWEFVETWEFKSYYATNLIYVRGANGNPTGVKYSSADEAAKMYTCWASEANSNILVGSSIKLSRDTIHQQIQFVPQNAWKMSYLYSINVKQYSPSAGGYEFLQRMKKNSENLGGLFDAQPSQLVSNIRCLQDPSEQVIGYIDVAQVTERRLFISRSQVSPWDYRENCEEESVLNNPDSINMVKDYLLPTKPAVTGIFGEIIRFFASSPTCVDCTTRGTSLKPSYWP